MIFIFLMIILFFYSLSYHLFSLMIFLSTIVLLYCFVAFFVFSKFILDPNMDFHTTVFSISFYHFFNCTIFFIEQHFLYTNIYILHYFTFNNGYQAKIVLDKNSEMRLRLCSQVSGAFNFYLYLFYTYFVIYLHFIVFLFFYLSSLSFY